MWPPEQNPALPVNIKFEVEAVLSMYSHFQLNSDYCTNMSQGACTYCSILNYEAQLCYYNDNISSNSQAGLWNKGMCCYGQLVCIFQRTGFTSFESIYGCLSVYRHNVSHCFHSYCLSQLVLLTFKLLIYNNTYPFYTTQNLPWQLKNIMFSWKVVFHIHDAFRSITREPRNQSLPFFLLPHNWTSIYINLVSFS